MVDKANAKNGNAFLEQYQDESNKLVAASGTPGKQENICADIKGWYGSFGGRIADLLRWSQEARSEGEGKPKSAGGGSGKRKGRGPDK